MKTKVIEVSELQRFEANIEALKNDSAVSSALIENSIEDLKGINALMRGQADEISVMITNLVDQKADLEVSIKMNESLIEKLSEAFA